MSSNNMNSVMYNASNLDMDLNYHSVTNRKRETRQIPEQEESHTLTPRTVHKYRMANKKYEDLLSNIGSDSTLTRKQDYNTPGLFPSVTGRNVNAGPIESRRGGSDGLLEHNSFPRKRQRFDTKKLTIKVPQYTNKEARAPVPMDEQRERTSLPHIMNSDTDNNVPADFASSDFPSMTPMTILTSELNPLEGFSPLPITPSSSTIPCWPWTPTPKVGSEFNNWGIEPPLKKPKFS